MKRRIYTLAIMLLITMLAVSPVYAAKYAVNPNLGSLVVTVDGWGAGKDPSATLTSVMGIPLAYCIDPGDNGNIVPGQNPTEQTAFDVEKDIQLEGKNGKFTVSLETNLDFDSILPKDYGCPNNKWIADPYFVEWTGFTLTIQNSRGELFNQSYSCHTEYTGEASPNYLATPNYPFDDGTIECWEN